MNHPAFSFRNQWAEDTFQRKYAHKEGANTWPELCHTLTYEVAGDILSPSELSLLQESMTDMKFVPGGRYLYYAGRPLSFYNNCYLLKAEFDTREEWGALVKRASDCLMTGGGIGIDYSILRERGARLSRTGGEASGPIPLMEAINEYGRRVQQGGSRRSAIYGSLNWQHPDAKEFLSVKDWNSQHVKGTTSTIGDLKAADFNYPAPLDMTNISLNYDDAFLESVARGELPPIFLENVRRALQNGEPGFSFNFGDKQGETLRNACTEVTSSDDSDVCNLGSLNLGAFDTIEDFRSVVRIGTYFLLCGTLKADLPYQKVKEVRNKNRRLGLGLMGIHEWLMKRGYGYEVVPELKQWLQVYQDESDAAARELADQLSISRPVAVRAVAPTGTIGILAGTTTGIEPLFAVAYKRRFLEGFRNWKYQYVVDGTAKELIDRYGLKPDGIQTALDLAATPDCRIAFQADIQDYVDMSISSTINLPAWGSELNNEDTVEDFAQILARYAHRLRGFTAYPDGARGGQPLTPVDYYEARDKDGIVFEEEAGMDICSLTGGGTCGI
jgi:ribonucleoside-diphosphate reductase alpha chain